MIRKKVQARQNRVKSKNQQSSGEPSSLSDKHPKFHDYWRLRIKILKVMFDYEKWPRTETLRVQSSRLLLTLTQICEDRRESRKNKKWMTLSIVVSQRKLWIKVEGLTTLNASMKRGSASHKARVRRRKQIRN